MEVAQSTKAVILSEAKNLKFSREIRVKNVKTLRFFPSLRCLRNDNAGYPTA